MTRAEATQTNWLLGSRSPGTQVLDSKIVLKSGCTLGSSSLVPGRIHFCKAFKRFLKIPLPKGNECKIAEYIGKDISYCKKKKKAIKQAHNFQEVEFQ